MNRRAFTLLELSIVLVIIGLFAGGVLVGRDLIRASGVNGLTKQFNQYRGNVISFRDRFAALPGDMSNAQQFWGAQDIIGAGTSNRNNCAKIDVSSSPATLNPNPTATCNGNGDNDIDKSYTGAPTAYDKYERCRFWQHLSNAGYIDTALSGICYFTGGGGHAWQGWTNTPGTPFGNGVFNAASEYSLGGSTRNGTITSGGVTFVTPNEVTQPPVNKGLYLLALGSIRPNGSFSGSANALLTPQEAKNIDLKVDDGFPATGTIISAKNFQYSSQYRNGGNPNFLRCTNSYTAIIAAGSSAPTATIGSNAEYNISEQSIVCPLFIVVTK